MFQTPSPSIYAKTLCFLWLASSCSTHVAPPPQISSSIDATPDDSDGDGFSGEDDACPEVPEDGNLPDPGDGCANRDLDGDGIPVSKDLCPREQGSEDALDGCPLRTPDVTVVGETIVLGTQKLFLPSSTRLNEAGRTALDALAQLLHKQPELDLIDIAAYSHEEGGAWFSRSLTSKRAEFVTRWLVAHGVAQKRLLSQGYGSFCGQPETPAGQRLVIRIMRRAGISSGQDGRGCSAAERAGVLPSPIPTETASPASTSLSANSAALAPLGHKRKAEKLLRSSPPTNAQPERAEASPTTPR